MASVTREDEFPEPELRPMHELDVPVVVTIEEHTLIGGLGSAVTDALVERCRSRLPLIRRLGIPDVFAVKYGNQDELMAMYGLQPPQIADAVREALKLVST